MCTNQKTKIHHIIWNERIYMGVDWKKPTLGDSKEYKEKYEEHLKSLPNFPVPGVSSGNYIYKTAKIS